ncbi:MAG: helix-turn-helix transcriptional regulator, partial [Spirochaetales bacterium]|nr:helix-turn-helix transcriptional regulator [Spirochaetales bacterium]
EFEVVSCTKIRHVNIFLNKIRFRNFHMHSEIEIMYVVRGSALVTCGNSNLVAREGSVLLFNSNQAHEIDAAISGSDITTVIVQISKGFLQDYFPDMKTIFFEKNDLSAVLNCDELVGLAEKIKDAARCYISERKLYEIQTIENVSKILRFVLEKVPYVQRDEDYYLAKKSNEQRMDRIFSFIDKNYRLPIRLTEIAENEGLTISHLSYLFSNNLGVRFQDYLNDRRFEHAFRLIHNRSKSLHDVSIESGFSDPRYMKQMFEKKLNCTPQFYRQSAEQRAEIVNDKQPSPALEYFYTKKESLAILDGFYEKKDNPFDEITFHFLDRD